MSTKGVGDTNNGLNSAAATAAEDDEGVEAGLDVVAVVLASTELEAGAEEPAGVALLPEN